MRGFARIFGGLALLCASLPSAAQTSAAPASDQGAVPILDRGLWAQPDPARTPKHDAIGRGLLRLPAFDRRPPSREDIPPLPQVAAIPRDQIVIADVLLSLDERGRVENCSLVDVGLYYSHRNNQQVDNAAVPTGMDVASCINASYSFSYKYALDIEGNPVSATLALRLFFDDFVDDFLRMPRRLDGSLMRDDRSPSWVVAEEEWLPVGFSPQRYQRFPFVVPEGGRFLAGVRRQGSTDVGVLLSINSVGDVTSCRVVMASGVANYDAATCPAASSVRHQSTSPVREVFGNVIVPLLVRWNGDQIELVRPVDPTGPELIEPVVPVASRLEGVAPEGLQSVQVELSVSPDGIVQHCRVVSSGNDDRLDIASCALFNIHTRVTRPIGVFAEPTEGRLELTVDWRRLRVERRPDRAPPAAPPTRRER